MMKETDGQIMFVYFVIDLEILIRSRKKGVFFLGDFVIEGSFIFDIIEWQYKNQANAENNCNKNR